MRRFSFLYMRRWRSVKTLLPHSTRFKGASSQHHFSQTPRSAAFQQPGEIITRLAPSLRVPGLKGVFLTKPIKKFHPIEVLPAAATATKSLRVAGPSSTRTYDFNELYSTAYSTDINNVLASSNRYTNGTHKTEGTSKSEERYEGKAKSGDVVTQAPPIVLNLAFAPRHHISLRRFLALRHMFSSSAYLHAATEDGWYLIAPSTAAPLCADVAGLEKWVSTHHRRYLEHGGERSAKSANENVSSSFSTLADRQESEQQERGQRKSSDVQHKPITEATAQATSWSAKGELSDRDAELAKLEAALDNGEELTEAQLRVMVESEKKRTRAADQEDADADADDNDLVNDDDDDGDGLESEVVNGKRWKDAETSTIAESSMKAASLAHARSDRADSKSASASGAAQLRSLPPLITEAHLFELNDGVYWELPPTDDLASHEYWKAHRQRMALYESTGDTDAAEQREALLENIRSDPRAAQCTEQQLHAAADTLFQTLKQKANVMLSVDGKRGLLTLVPLQDLHAGDELFVHYGREWWTGRLLSSLLLAVSDDQMGQTRWIEQLFGHESDRNELFPLLVPAYQQRKHKGRRAHTRLSPPASKEAQTVTDNNLITAEENNINDAITAAADGSRTPLSSCHRGTLVLYNTVTHRKATDAAVLAFAIRRSCVDQDFFDRLVLGNVARGVPPVFRLSEPDVEVPMRVLRRVLLNSLRGVPEDATLFTETEEETSDQMRCTNEEKRLSGSDPASSSVTLQDKFSGGGGRKGRLAGHTGAADDDDGVFSV